MASESAEASTGLLVEPTTLGYLRTCSQLLLRQGFRSREFNVVLGRSIVFPRAADWLTALLPAGNLVFTV